MKATFKQADLVRELQLLSAVIDRKVTIPVLSGVLIEASGAGAALTATNIDNTLRSQLTAAVEREGRCVLAADRLLALVSRSFGEMAQIDAAKDSAGIVIGTSTAKLPLLSVADFPVPPTADTADAIVTIAATALLDVIERVRHAMSDTFSTAKGGRVEVTVGHLSMLAADGPRIAIASMDVTASREASFTLSAKAWDACAKWLRGVDDQAAVAVAGDDDRTVFTCDGRVLSCRVLDGKYPNVRRLVPAKSAHAVTVDAGQLAGVMKRHLTLSTFDKCRVALRFAPHELRVQTATPLGEAEDILAIDGFPDGAFAIGVNPQFLLDAVSALSTPRVDVCLTDPASPLLLRPSSDPARMTAVIAAMQL